MTHKKDINVSGLVLYWLEWINEESQFPLHFHLSRMNKQCNLKIDYSRISKWRKGEGSPNVDCRKFMLNDIAKWYLAKLGIRKIDSERVEMLINGMS